MKNKAYYRIVLCGSMSFYGELLQIQKILTQKSIHSIVPPCDEGMQLSLTDVMFEKHKRLAAFDYIKKIRDPRTYAILAVNLDKHGITNYIGPNTFAEIAIAYAQRKNIYILSDYPTIYEDELNAWEAVRLYGSLDPLIRDYHKYLEQKEIEDNQIKIF